MEQPLILALFIGLPWLSLLVDCRHRTGKRSRVKVVMMRMFAAVLFAGLLSGCVTLEPGKNAFQTGFNTMPAKYCTTDNTPAQKADWTNATVVEEGVKDSFYQSGLMELTQNRPHILRITNNDDGLRSFRAPDFLRDAAILKAVYDKQSVEAPCLNAITMAPGKTAELHIVPLKAGGYDYYETVFWVPHVGQFVTGADSGFIYVR